MAGRLRQRGAERAARGGVRSSRPGRRLAGQTRDHSFGWVCARDGAALVGFVNVAWDGGVHAFVLDTMVARHARRRGIGARLVAAAVEGARAAACELLHVDFGDELRAFYFGACGFAPTNAGLIAL